MIVYVLFVHIKICFKEKSFYYFHKKLKNIKKFKKTQKTYFYCFFLGVFFWLSLGGFFIANPAFSASTP
jgi:hypothetical protein